MLAGLLRVGLRLREMVGTDVEIVGGIGIEPLHHDRQHDAGRDLIAGDRFVATRRAVDELLVIHFHHADLLIFDVIFVARFHRGQGLLTIVKEPPVIRGQKLPAGHTLLGFVAIRLLGRHRQQLHDGVVFLASQRFKRLCERGFESAVFVCHRFGRRVIGRLVLLRLLKHALHRDWLLLSRHRFFFGLWLGPRRPSAFRSWRRWLARRHGAIGCGIGRSVVVFTGSPRVLLRRSDRVSRRLDMGCMTLGRLRGVEFPTLELPILELPIRGVVDEPAGQGGKRQHRQGDACHRGLLPIHGRADGDRLDTTAVAVKRSARHRRRHRGHGSRHDGRHARNHCLSLRNHRHGSRRGGPLRWRRGHGKRDSGTGLGPRRDGGDLGEQLLPRLLNTLDETCPCHRERTRRNCTQQIQAGFGRLQDNQRIGLLRRHTQHEAGISQINCVDTEPLSTGIERSVCRH